MIGIIRKTPLSERILFLSLLGPIFLAISFLLLLLGEGNYSLLIFAVLLGVMGIWRWQKRGLFLAVTVLFSTGLVEHAWIYQHHLWNLGIETALILSLYICYQGFDFVRLSVEKEKETQRNLQKNCNVFTQEIEREKGIYSAHYTDLQNKYIALEKGIAQKEEKISSYGILMNELQEKTETYKKELDGKEQVLKEKEQCISLLQKELKDITAKQEGLLSLQEKNQALIKQAALLEEKICALDQSSVSVKQQLLEEIEQKRLLRQQLEEQKEKFLVQEKQFKEKSKQAMSHSKVLFPGKKQNMAANYIELRKQFEAKTEVLHQTRKELFAAQEKCLAISLGEQYRLLEPSALEEVLWKNMVEVEEERTRLEQENSLLEDLVSYLQEQIKPLQNNPYQQQNFNF
ncbi:MAG: hypothetical protein JW769_00530 [Parachlamydiales bacterium]|nr:hypothetical protein [Parachlamydiales bacterium]